MVLWLLKINYKIMKAFNYLYYKKISFKKLTSQASIYYHICN